MVIDPGTMGWGDVYKYLIGAVLPRPIAFVSTVDEEGRTNLAPFSFFTVVAANPPTICFSTMRRGSDGAKKDTLRNIEATKEFVVNIVSESFVEQMNKTAAELPHGESEFDFSGLTPVASTKVKAPRVQESHVHLECRLTQIVEVGGDEAGAASLILGEVIALHVDESVHRGDGKVGIDTAALQPLGRLAGNDYVRVTDTFELIRKK